MKIECMNLMCGCTDSLRIALNSIVSCSVYNQFLKVIETSLVKDL